MEDVDVAVRNLEIKSLSFLSVYQKDKSFGVADINLKITRFPSKISRTRSHQILWSGTPFVIVGKKPFWYEVLSRLITTRFVWVAKTTIRHVLAWIGVKPCCPVTTSYPSLVAMSQMYPGNLYRRDTLYLLFSFWIMKLLATILLTLIMSKPSPF
ncbi:uncharacterized protein LOC130649139 [Hydractinia symbiolongicarpus]|uniref:uncharacterized protein LOC130632392 n=1 Tax=Hydractinia symbiolongicarpus TaxID=13093 RepID=UPI00254DE89D|nr:uncharacterized protein LOC130632392 [Hydractinia symbiolongicarpus]XP_057311347.1 uncharacterized protein LOC130649139 [Hydractinia symbiolongicarpus]